MHRFASLVAFILALGWGLCIYGEEPITLHGEYTWNVDDRREPLTATFESSGEDIWKVTFRFETKGRPHVYEGTAKGSLKQGSLEGEVRSENRSQLYRFDGTVEDGRFEGRHVNIFEGERRVGGELILGLEPVTVQSRTGH